MKDRRARSACLAADTSEDNRQGDSAIEQDAEVADKPLDDSTTKEAGSSHAKGAQVVKTYQIRRTSPWLADEHPLDTPRHAANARTGACIVPIAGRTR